MTTTTVRRARPPLPAWVRAGLLAVAFGLVGVFALALWIDPYTVGPDGERVPRIMESHTQLGLPPCRFKVMSGLPCPSCGMTTSFSLLMHGDVFASLQANAVGTLLAVFWVVLIPWSVASSWRGRYLGIRHLEPALLWAVGIFLILMLARWAIVVAGGWV